MGKKHKKHHRLDKNDDEVETPEKSSSMDPPLRLVLKVGKGSETIMTASPNSDHFSMTADSPSTPEPEYGKHGHHKKKKKKRKGDHDRKRSSAHLDDSQSMTPDTQEEDEELEGSEEGTEEGAWNDPSATKKLLLAMQERRAKPVVRLCKDDVPPPEKKPLVKVLENLQKTLQRKDVDGFFAWPVNDIIAPGYSSIITHPMDFSTMKKKIERGEYDSIDEYKADFILMCENAKTYNRPETIYYKAARKLLTTGTRAMSKERLATIKRAFGYAEDGEVIVKKPKGRPKKVQVTKESAPLGDQPDLMDTSTRDTMDTMMDDDSSYIADTDIMGKSDDEDDMDEDDAKVLIQEVLEAAKAAKDRLTARQPNSKIGFLRKDKAGTTSLAILNPDRDGEADRRVNLSMLTPRLAHGTSSLPGFKEDKRNKALPVSYLQYGPFCSFGPQYDSTFSNLSKEDSDLLYGTYGDEEGIKYAQSIQEFVKDSGDHVNQMVDTLLDSLTNGQHSRTKEQLKQNQEIREKHKELGSEMMVDSSGQTKFDFEGLKSLADEGIDVSFLPSLEKELATMEQMKSEMKRDVDQKLGKAATLIRDLERTQNERLSRKPPQHLQYVAGPTDQEYVIAEQITTQLKDLASKSMPGNLTSTRAVRKAMGVTLEPLADSLTTTSLLATSQTGPSESGEGSIASALPDDIAKELEGDDGVMGDGDDRDDDDDVDADVGDELLEMLGDKV